MDKDRRNGKTTRLMELAVDALGDLPENETVYITGAHTRHVFELEREFKDAGLDGVVFVAKGSIMDGKLRGARGILLIDDINDLTDKEYFMLQDEQNRLQHTSNSARQRR